VYFDVYEKGKKALEAGGIEIPFPQLVLHQANSLFLRAYIPRCF